MKPLKRIPEMQPFSHDHHDGLLLCWKIRNGLSKGIEHERIWKYATWMFDEHLLPHFEEEEKFVFPVLGKENANVKLALEQHQNLKNYIGSTVSENALNSFANELEGHIRFEERILFNEIQEAASPEQLKQISNSHNHRISCDNWSDRFWDRASV